MTAHVCSEIENCAPHVHLDISSEAISWIKHAQRASENTTRREAMATTKSVALVPTKPESEVEAEAEPEAEPRSEPDTQAAEPEAEPERESEAQADTRPEPPVDHTTHEKQQSHLRILCIDGGGIKGLVPAIVIQQIEKVCGGHPIHKLFDLVCETSTGGIIALSHMDFRLRCLWSTSLNLKRVKTAPSCSTPSRHTPAVVTNSSNNTRGRRASRQPSTLILS